MVHGVVHDVIRQHAEDASFLWLQRDFMVGSPHYDLADMAKHDERLGANLDGLRVAGDAGRQVMLDAIECEEPGDVFAAAVSAVMSADAETVRKILAIVSRSSDALRGLVSALGWLPLSLVKGIVEAGLSHPDPVRRELAVAALAMHRYAGESGVLPVTDEHPSVRARAMRAAGELRRRDFLPHLEAQFHSDDEACRFWAAWSMVMVGEMAGIEPLKTFVDFNTPFACRAIQLAPRVMSLDASRNWLGGLARQTTTRRHALIGCGVVGDPGYIPAVITQMSIPEHARVAGEALSMITGIDLAYEDLEGEWPDGFEAGPTEDPEDESVEMDPDENLPWPNRDLVQRWWDTNGNAFRPGQRYLCGHAISPENCQRVLREGLQRQRIAAAYELALRNPTDPLFEWRAPGERQQVWLGLKSSRS